MILLADIAYRQQPNKLLSDVLQALHRSTHINPPPPQIKTRINTRRKPAHKQTQCLKNQALDLTLSQIQQAAKSTNSRCLSSHDRLREQRPPLTLQKADKPGRFTYTQQGMGHARRKVFNVQPTRAVTERQDKHKDEQQPDPSTRLKPITPSSLDDPPPPLTEVPYRKKAPTTCLVKRHRYPFAAPTPPSIRRAGYMSSLAVCSPPWQQTHPLSPHRPAHPVTAGPSCSI